MATVFDIGDLKSIGNAVSSTPGGVGQLVPANQAWMGIAVAVHPLTVTVSGGAGGTATNIGGDNFFFVALAGSTVSNAQNLIYGGFFTVPVNVL